MAHASALALAALLGASACGHDGVTTCIRVCTKEASCTDSTVTGDYAAACAQICQAAQGFDRDALERRARCLSEPCGAFERCLRAADGR
ncbi:MAG: hypothetical protein IT373_20670 [Polyangiaceae bacterium]|nr:hypothetical protein [Polyangiaceae bacterium]